MDKTQFTKEEAEELKKSALKNRFKGSPDKLPEDHAQKLEPLLAEELRENPLQYLTYGVYWWDLKEALKAQKQKGWWNSSESDDFLIGLSPNAAEAILIAMIYAEYNMDQQSMDHYRLDKDGEAIPYTLTDYAAIH